MNFDIYNDLRKFFGPSEAHLVGQYGPLKIGPKNQGEKSGKSGFLKNGVFEALLLNFGKIRLRHWIRLEKLP